MTYLEKLKQQLAFAMLVREVDGNRYVSDTSIPYVSDLEEQIAALEALGGGDEDVPTSEA